LFFVSRFDNDQLQINKINVNLSAYLQKTIESLGYLSAERNNPLELAAENNIEVELDPDLMRQVLTNLIDNAIKYGNENESIKINGCRQNGAVKVSVINKGEGIPEEDIGRIFERFYRVESSRSRKTGGTGLGLSIVKSIIKLHGGEISVNSIPGKETEFYFTLPV
jgi:signal transduction histidine kinase